MKTETKTKISKQTYQASRWVVTAVSTVVLLAQLMVGTDIVFGTNIPDVAIRWGAAVILAGAIIGFAINVHKNSNK